MSTSTYLIIRSIFSAIFSFILVGALTASTASFTATDSCTADIVVEYDSTGSYALLTVTHSGSPNSTIQWSDSSTIEQRTVTASGEYCVTVYTETQCAVTKCINVNLGTATDCHSYIIKEPLTNGEYMLIVETTDPNPNTAYQWTSGESTNSIIVNQSGEYCIDVASSNGCLSQACIYVDIPVQNDSCSVTMFSYPDTIYGGEYVGVDPSGVSPFTYSWSTGSTENGIDVQYSGEYCVTVTDAEGCIAVGCKLVEIPTTTPIDSCHSWIVKTYLGETDNRYKLSVESEGIAPFTIVWHDSTYQDGDYLYVEESGNYCVFVYDANQCVSEACIQVEIESTTTDTCHFAVTVFEQTRTTELVTLGADPAGVGPFVYTWSNGIEGEHFDVQTEGEYCVTITDANGCVGTACYFVEFETIIDTCSVWLEQIPQADGSVKVWAHAQGGGSESYAWNNDAAGVAGEPYIYVSESGEYCVTVYDANQCAATACIDVQIATTEPSDSCTISVYIYEVERTAGLVKLGVETTDTTVLASGVWLDGSTEEYLYVQEAGNYCVTVVDEDGCVGTACYFVEFETIIDTCSVWLEQIPQADGSVKVWAHAQGGGSESYAWNNDAAGVAGEPYIYVSESGEYCVTVYDANQCAATACIDVQIATTEPTDSCTVGVYIYEVERTTGLVKLGVETTDTTVLASGVWLDGSTEEYLYVQEAGNYCVTVVDEDGCVGTACYFVEFETIIDTCSVWLEQIPQADGSVKVWAHGQGGGSESYAWNNDPAGTASEPYIYVSESGEYCVIVYDANQCAATACIDVQIATTEPTDSCTVGVYIYEVERTAGLVKLGVETTDTTVLASGVWLDGSTEEYIYVQEAGNYCVTVVDEDGCVGTACYFVEFETVIDTCSVWLEQIPQADGSVKVWAHAQGSGSQSYTWNNDPTGVAGEPYIYVSESGEYCVTVYDANQCAATACIDVQIATTEPSDSCTISVYIYEVERTAGLVKLGVETTDTTVLASGAWSDGSTEEYLYVQEAGNYCVTVVDEDGCEGTACYFVEFETVIDTCSVWLEQIPQADGSVKVWAHAQGGGSEIYTWNNDPAGVAGEPYIYVSESGEYCVTVYDANQCASTACILIEIPTTEPIDSCHSWIVKTHLGDTDNRYKLSVESEGAAPFTIVWHDSTYQDGGYLYAEESGNYCVTVYDANQCVSEACIQVEIETTTEPIDSCTLELVTNVFATDYLAEVKAEATGTGPFSYVWSDGTSGNAIEVNTNQEVCVTVTDANGCVSTKCINVEVPQRPCSLQVIRSNNSTDTLVTLEAIVEGEGDITFAWSNGSNDDHISVTESGEYCLTITAANGCSKTECIFIDIESIVCNTEININPNSSDYEVILDAAPNGVGPFTFAWSNGSQETAIVVTESGNYCLLVTDARGCVSEYCKEVVVKVPVCESRIAIQSEADDEVTIEVETDGMAPFTYYWSSGEGSQSITVTVSKEYCVEVIDALGCISYDCKYIEVVDYSTCSVEIEVISNADSTEHKVIANPSGTAPFTYQWAHGDTSRYFYPVLDGNFCVTVTDAEGCVSEICLQTEGITPVVELEAFPNPAQGDFFIEIDSELEFQGRVEIRDMKGNLLFTVPIDVEKGIQGMNFNSDEYPSGIFFVNIIRGSHVESIKVIKASN